MRCAPFLVQRFGLSSCVAFGLFGVALRTCVALGVYAFFVMFAASVLCVVGFACFARFEFMCGEFNKERKTGDKHES